MKTKVILFAMLALVFVASLTAALARAQPQASDAKSILKAMSDYVSNQKTIEMAFDSDIEVITPQLEKIQFTNYGQIPICGTDLPPRLVARLSRGI